MSMKSVESQGKTLELAIESGLTELNTTKEKVDIEIVSQGGLFKKPTVRLTLKRTAGDRALEFVEGFIEKLGIAAFAELTETDDTASVNIEGADISVLIGYRGEVLDAVQYLASLVANRDKPGFKRITVDGEGYRSKRSNTLEELADKLAAKALDQQRSVSTEPMNPYERRVIHSHLQKNGEVTTHSEGEEPNRYLVITPKGVTPGGHKVPTRGGSGRDNRNGGYRGNANGNGNGNGRGGSGGYKGGGQGQGGRGRSQGRDRDRDSGRSRPAAAAAQAPAQQSAPAKKSAAGNSPRQYAFRSINRRPSPYSSVGSKQSGFSDDALGKQSGFSDAALMEKDSSKYFKD